MPIRCSLLILLLAAGSGGAIELPRSGFLGIAPQPSNKGLLIARIVPEATADRAGARVGDVLVGLDGRAIEQPGDFVAAARALESGSHVRLSVLREGQRRELQGTVTPRPKEVPETGSVRYDALAYGGGRLRVLVNRPDGEAPFPTVLYLQGLSCQSVESPNPDNFNRRNVRAFVEAGFAVVRVEKPGMGDSDGPLRCEDIDFMTETGAFRAAWEYAIALPESRDDALFMVGISMGGIQAPIVAAESATKPLGTVVWGTRLDHWYDYMIELLAVQPVLFGTADPVEAHEAAEDMRPILRRLFLEGQSLDEVLADEPGARERLQNVGLGPGGRFFGRDVSFFQGISRQNLRAAWRDGGGAVLSLYGESDITAISGFEQELIATVVNHYRPGTATFTTVPGTNHPMARVGSRSEYRRRISEAGGMGISAEFNEEVLATMTRWALSVLADADAPE